MSLAISLIYTISNRTGLQKYKLTNDCEGRIRYDIKSIDGSAMRVKLKLIDRVITYSIYVFEI